MGIGAAVMSASYLAGRASSVTRRPGPSRGQLAQRHLEQATDTTGGGESGGGSGGGRGGPVPPALPSGAGAPEGGGGSTGDHGSGGNKSKPGNPPVAAGGATEPTGSTGAPTSWVDRVSARLTSTAAQDLPDPGEAPGTPVDDADSFPEPEPGARDGGPGSTRATQAAARSTAATPSAPSGSAQQHVSPPTADEGSLRDQRDGDRPRIAPGRRLASHE